MASELEMILDDMHTAILAGDFSRLSALVPDLEAAQHLVEETGHPNPAVLKDKAARNAVCLQAALFGVKSARRRVVDIADAARGLTTYNRGGGKATLTVAPPNLRRV